MLKEEKHKGLIVEALKAKHLPMFASSKQSERIAWMQIMLLKTWLSEAEAKLKGLIPSRQPRCLVALEYETLIAIIVLNPNNRRGTSWSISLPEFINEPQKISKSEIIKIMLLKVLKQENNIARSWIIRCPSMDTQQLSLFREQGFQPLKILKTWTYAPIDKTKKEHLSYPNNIFWEPLSKSNAKLLYFLKKSSESVYLRELLDIQWVDLLDNNKNTNGVIVTQTKQQRSAILGLATPICAEKKLSLELIRDIAWDSRINNILAITLNNLICLEPKISIEISSEDKQLNNMIDKLNWVEQYEQVILGRSLWKRKINSKFIMKENSLSSIFIGLKPNQPPLPTPISHND